MFGYYIDLALRSLRCNKAPTMLHVLSGDPLPESSVTLFYAQLDTYDTSGYETGGKPSDQHTWIDGMNLLYAEHVDRQEWMHGGKKSAGNPGHAAGRR